MLKECTYKELKEGDVFKLFKNDKRIYRKDKEGDIEIVDAYGCRRLPPFFKVYCYLSMPVFKIVSEPPSCLTNDERREELLERYKEE